MKYFVTGGCGFLGSNICEKLLESDSNEVTVFDNLSRVGAFENLEWLRSRGPIKFIHGDIRNEDDVRNGVKLEQPDIIYHLAGQVALTVSIEKPLLDFQVNAVGTINLLEAVREFCPATTIVFSSTNKVYGDLSGFTYEERDKRLVCLERPKGFAETESIDLHSPYGCSKGAADQYVLDYARVYDLKTVVLRHSSMFGGRQYATEDQGWVGWFAEQALRLKNQQTSGPVKVAGSGKQVRDLLFSDDCVELYLSIVNEIDKVRGQAFNVGGGMENSSSIIELLEFFEEDLGISIEMQVEKPRLSDQLVFVADTTRLRQEIDWVPRISKTEGLRKMIDWVQSIINK